MKIIDLLNKIANGEEVPRKFEVNGRIWEWNVHSYNCELHSEFAVTGLRYDLSNLNDEIKILDIEYLNNDLGNKLIKPFLEEEKKDNFTGWKMYQDGKEVCSMDCSVEEKKIPEKLESYISCGWNGTCKDLKRDELFEDLKKIGNKINEIIDYLKSKGE